MIKNLSFANFRGLKALDLTNLEQVTLISGKNNAGKSSILEGIFLLIDHLAPESFTKINRFRNLPLTSDHSTLWEPVFNNLNTDIPVTISMDLDGVPHEVKYIKDRDFIPTEVGGTPQDMWNQFVSSAKSSYSLKFIFSADEYREEGHFVVSASGMLRHFKTNQTNNEVRPCPFVQFINTSILNNDQVIIEWFGKLELQGQKSKIVDVLKILDDSITDISTIALKGQIQLYAKMHDKLLPLKLAGDGLNRLLFLVLAIVANPHSIILIDEIESGFHYSMYPKLWQVIASAARDNDCQIIATTHSYECIDGAIEGIENVNMINSFCFYRIEGNENTNKSFRYSGTLLRYAVDASLEVR